MFFSRGILDMQKREGGTMILGERAGEGRSASRAGIQIAGAKDIAQ